MKMLNHVLLARGQTLVSAFLRLMYTISCTSYLLSLPIVKASSLINHDQCSIRIVYFNRLCLRWLFVCFSSLYTHDYDIQSSWIRQYKITDIIIIIKKKQRPRMRQIKRKVRPEEHRQISGHATISVRIVRVCAQWLYIVVTFRVKICFRYRLTLDEFDFVVLAFITTNPIILSRFNWV
jgi:hypothetical protein